MDFFLGKNKQACLFIRGLIVVRDHNWPGLGPFLGPIDLIMCPIDDLTQVATHHHDDLDLFTFFFSIRVLLDT